MIAPPSPRRRAAVRGAAVARRATLLALAACAQIADLQDPAPLAGDGPGPTGSSAATGEDVDPAKILIGPERIDLGTVACGEVPANLPPITIRNTADRPVPFEVKLPEGSAFTFAGASSGTVQPGAVATVTVTASPSVPRELTVDALVTVGRAFQPIPVRVEGRGARVEITPGVADFGAVRYQVGGTPIDVELRNVGNTAATVETFEGGTASFSLEAPLPLRIEPGASAIVKAKLAAGAQAAVPPDATVTARVSAPHCGPVPSLVMRGKLENVDVTATIADFGKQGCNTTPTGQREIAITNYSTRTSGYTATLTAGAASAFVVTAGASGTLAGAGTSPSSAIVTVAAKPVGGTLAPVDEELRIDFASADLLDLSTRVRMDVRGAIVSAAPTLRNFRYYGGDFAVADSYQITNTGNDPVDVAPLFTRTAGDPAWYYSPIGTIEPGRSRTYTVAFKPSQECGCEAKTDLVTSGARVCAALPVLVARGTYTK